MAGSSGLRRFVTNPGGPADLAHSNQSVVAKSPYIETCDMCATEIPAEHGHVADLEASSLMCACRACYLLFTQPDAGRGSSAGPGGRPPGTPRYRAVPDRYLADPAHPVTALEFDALEIPVGLAFFLRDSREGSVTAFYPSPAGATECRLDLAAWDELVADHPLLAAPETDVEAVLIAKGSEGSSPQPAVECFVVPIDACYELAGRMRLHWRGFDGGSQARAGIADFLDGVRARARTFDPGAAHG